MRRTIMSVTIATVAIAGFHTTPSTLASRAVAYAEVNDDIYHFPFSNGAVRKPLRSDGTTSGNGMQSVESTARRCSDAPEHAVLTFFRGIDEFNLGLLQSVIPEEVSVFTVFGGGDAGTGRTVVRQILEHPELGRGNEVDSTYVLLEMRDGGEVSEKEIHIERRDRVFLSREDMREVEQVYRRVFLVKLDPLGNCILRVRPVGHEWNRIR